MSLDTFFSHLRRSSGLLERMTAKLGLRSHMAALPGSANVLRRAEARCFTCGHADACESWLSSAESPAEAPGYCRNHDLFARLAAQSESGRGTQAVAI